MADRMDMDACAEGDVRPSTAADNDLVHQRLRAYNRQFVRELRDYSSHIDVDGALAAGVVAGSTFDTLEVEFLFVDAAYRGRGLGGRLLRHVETLARRDGLKRVLLNTYSYQAPAFYRKMGYRAVAAITPCFGDVEQVFFEKRLD